MPDVTHLILLRLNEAYRVDDWPPDAMAAVGRHLEHLQELAGRGKVLLAGRTQYPNDHPDLIGLVLVCAESDDEASRIMLADPAVQEGLMTPSLHPYGVAVRGY